MSTLAIYRRAVRRETHSSRAGIAITLAVILALVLAWVGTESVLAVLGQPALLVAPSDGVTAVLTAAAAPAGLLIAAGAVVAIIGLVLIITSLAPGRRGRRPGGLDRTAAVVDDRVIAQSVARVASAAGNVRPEQVNVSVGARSVRVDIARTSGRDLSVREIEQAVKAEVASYDYRPALRASVRLTRKGDITR